MKYPLKKSFFTILIAAGIMIPVFASAANILPPCALDAGRCHLNDLIQTFINLARFFLGIVGSAVLLFFVYGGFVWLTSGGSSEKVKKGKDIVVNAIIGLIIVFGAFSIVQFVFDALDAGDVRIGQACEEGGIYAQDPRDPTGPLMCVTSCGDSILSGAGYTCMNPANGINCVYGICPAGENNVCCQPN